MYERNISFVRFSSLSKNVIKIDFMAIWVLDLIVRKLINLFLTAVRQVTILSNKLTIILQSIPLPIVSFCSIF